MTAESEEIVLDIFLHEPDYSGIQSLMIDLRMRSFSDFMYEAIRLVRWMALAQSENQATIIALTAEQNIIDPDFDFLRGFKPELPPFDMDCYSIDDDMEVIDHPEGTPQVHLIWTPEPAALEALNQLMIRLKLECQDDVVNACFGALQWAAEKTNARARHTCRYASR